MKLYCKFVVATFMASVVFVFAASSSIAFEQPNVLWLSAEDISPHFGCYGDPHAITPAIDRLASEGTRFSHAFTTSGVCAPCRSGIITGMYQTSLGTQHMRCTAQLPDFIKPFPIYLRDAGYYCTNNSKTDYQFKHPKETWDQSGRKAHWRNRTKKSQPFFSVFNYTGCHESGIANDEKYETITKSLSQNQRQDAKSLTTFPPYYPDTPAARDDWKRNYELITAMDHWANDIIEQLKSDGLYEDTIIFFWSDHGVGLPRAKRWLYDSGTRIPLVVRIPEKYRVDGQCQPGSVSDQLISSIDFGPTVLDLAGIKLQEHLDGQPFLGKQLPAPREYVFGARDRMDERYDIVRSVRDKQFRYIRNYEPLKTYYQFMNTPEQGRLMQEIRRGAKLGNLPPAAQQLMSPTKPIEELYDLNADPHEINNLASDHQYANRLQTMREVHLKWVRDTRDLGLIPEPILDARAKELGSQYAVLRQSSDENLNQRLGNIAHLASSGFEALPNLINALDDEDAAVRYWGLTGIGNIGDTPETESSTSDALLNSIKEQLSDRSATVRVAAARAMSRLGHPDLAIPVLASELKSDEEWIRLHAVIVLDEMGEAARPAIPDLHNALVDQPNKYIVRVANRALNQLEGTDRKVK